MVRLACVCLRTTARLQLLICWAAEPTFLAQLHGKHLGDTSCTGTCNPIPRPFPLDLLWELPMAKRYKRFTEGLTWNPVHGSLGRLPAKALEQVSSNPKSPLTVTHAYLVRQSCVTRSVISIERSPMEREHPNSLGRHRDFWRSPLTWCLLLSVHKQRHWHHLASLHGKMWHGKLFSLAVAWVALANTN